MKKIGKDLPAPLNRPEDPTLHGVIPAPQWLKDQVEAMSKRSQRFC